MKKLMDWINFILYYNESDKKIINLFEFIKTQSNLTHLISLSPIYPLTFFFIDGYAIQPNEISKKFSFKIILAIEIKEYFWIFLEE